MWSKEHGRWRRPDLLARRYVCVWADGIYLQARMEPQAECMPVMIVYRSTVVRHSVEAYAAKAAGGSCAARTWAGVL